MQKKYERNKKIVVYGTSAVVNAAESILDTLNGLEAQMSGYRLNNESDIRLIIQEAIDNHNIKASILVDGNGVYPYKIIVRQYEKLKKSGKLETMTDAFYKFLSLNFDIAHYDRRGYIAHYGNSFANMKKIVLDKATTPVWKTDVQRILDYIQGRSTVMSA
jgi:hypothetical protein